jgi:cardiolipin synthase
MAAIANAKDHVNFETYIFDEDEVGLKFADLLMEKQRAGVQVNIIYDSIGTLGVSKEFFQRLRDAGINLTEFNPVNPLKRFGNWRINNRDHRKMARSALPAASISPKTIRTAHCSVHARPPAPSWAGATPTCK